MALGEYLGAGSAITKGLYHLEGSANDSSGNGNNGTATNITYVDGIVGSGAASFNGSSSKIIKTGLSESFSNLTISCWIKKKRNTNNDRFVALFNPSGSGAELSILSPNTSEGHLAIIGYFGAYSYFARCDTGIPNNEWMYVVHTAGSSFNKLYINGVERSLTYNNGNTSSGLGANTFTNIGIGNNGNSYQFAQAEIDEVIIENRAWTPTEIQKYYTYSKGIFGII